MLNPTKGKIILSLGISVALVAIILTIPSLGLQSYFLSRGLLRQILDFILWVVIYYPLACGLVYIFKIILKKEKPQSKNLLIALLLIIIFNPVTFSLISTKITQENLCGLQITEINTTSAKSAGLVVGEVIKMVNSYPVKNMEALISALSNNRPEDTVVVVTNTNTYNVTLSENPQNPRQAMLGIKVNAIECKK